MLNSKDIAVFTLFLSRKINLDLIQCWVQEIRFCNDLFPQVFCNTTLKKYCKTDKISWDEGLFIKYLSLLGKSSWDPDINPQIHMQNCALSNFNGWDTKKKLKTTGHEQSVAHFFFLKKKHIWATGGKSAYLLCPGFYSSEQSELEYRGEQSRLLPPWAQMGTRGQDPVPAQQHWAEGRKKWGRTVGCSISTLKIGKNSREQVQC